MWVPGRDALGGDLLSHQLPPGYWDMRESGTMAPLTPRTVLLHGLLSSKSCQLLSLISISLRTPQELTHSARFVVRIGSLALAPIFFAPDKMF